MPGAALSLLLGAILTGCGHDRHFDGDDAAPPAASTAVPEVEAATARRTTIEQILPASGTLQASRADQANVSPAVAGIIDRILVRTGQPVARGQVIARLSTRQLIGQIEQARIAVAASDVQVQQAQESLLQQQAQYRVGIAQAAAALAQANAALRGALAAADGDRAALAGAQQNLDREESLKTEGLVAVKDVEAAELAVRAAQSQVDAQAETVDAQRQAAASAQAGVEAARDAELEIKVKRQDVATARIQASNARASLASTLRQAELYTLTAPLAGDVASVGASAGETVDEATHVATIANLDRLQLQINVPADSPSTVRPGQQVRFRVDALPGRTFSAAVASVGTDIDPASNTIQALAGVPNPLHRFSNGEFARVDVVIASRRQACVVPRSALQRDAEGGLTVAKLKSDSTIAVTPVRTGLSTRSVVEIVSGVAPGDRVVTAGGYGLPDGARVQATGAEAAQ